VIEALIRSHGNRVMSLLRRMLGNTEDARDVYQETWTSVWTALPRLRPDRDPWPYIRRAAMRKAIDRLRSESAAREHQRAVAEHIDTARQPPADTIDLDFLSEHERTCLTLFFWEGQSVRDIAQQLDVPEGTVKTWMFRARAQLRHRLETP